MSSDQEFFYWQQMLANAQSAIPTPFTTLRPRMFRDGDKWCALYGDDLQAGVAGFGDSPEQAAMDFDTAWGKKLTPYPKEKVQVSPERIADAVHDAKVKRRDTAERQRERMAAWVETGTENGPNGEERSVVAFLRGSERELLAKILRKAPLVTDKARP